jgi:flagellar biosynthesis protein FlgN
MSLQQALTRLLRDMEADVREYRSLQALLDAQFTAALGHESDRIEVLGRDIMTTVETLDTRRQVRMQLVCKLLPKHPQPGMAALFKSLPEPARAGMLVRWNTLEALVRDCKALNARNGYLMTQQQAMLNHVLLGEEADTYAAT